MELINKNETYLNDPEGYYLLDSTITRFDIYVDQVGLLIDVYFSLPFHRFKEDKQLKLHCVGVKEYEFYWNKQYNFYIVERYKFLETETGFYISFDPYDESKEISDEDHDMILCNEVELYLI